MFTHSSFFSSHAPHRWSDRLRGQQLLQGEHVQEHGHVRFAGGPGGRVAAKDAATDRLELPPEGRIPFRGRRKRPKLRQKGHAERRVSLNTLIASRATS